jgi:nucleoside-diphosphate-sugar epimerase
MRVLVAGAGGSVGRQLVPMLAACGHDVAAVSPRPPTFGAEVPGSVRFVVTDVLDHPRVARLVQEFSPEVVVNLVATPSPAVDPKQPAREPSLLNRLRAEGTANLMEAADELSDVYVMSESMAYAYQPHRGSIAMDDVLADEETPLWLRPPRQFAWTLGALRSLESRTARSGGVVLRLGHPYGPGTIYAADGAFTQRVRRGKAPVVGGGRSVFSFIHAHDAATAFVAAMNRRATGTFNIVDDQPAHTSMWLPLFAEMLGARAPRDRLSGVEWLVSGGWGLAFTTRLRGADNGRARVQLGWSPRYPSWREGFKEVNGATAVAR